MMPGTLHKFPFNVPHVAPRIPIPAWRPVFTRRMETTLERDGNIIHVSVPAHQFGEYKSIEFVAFKADEFELKFALRIVPHDNIPELK
jgi:hypothetical protein